MTNHSLHVGGGRDVLVNDKKRVVSTAGDNILLLFS